MHYACKEEVVRPGSRRVFRVASTEAIGGGSLPRLIGWV